MKETKTLTEVSEFHTMFDHPIKQLPGIPDIQRVRLRYSLMFEELEEFKQACEDGDIVAVADALADLQYVLTGTVLEFGLGHVFAELNSEVHRSNMSKACRTMEEAEATQKSYPHDHTIIRKKGELFLVYRSEDMKTLKNVNYSPANLHPIVIK